MRSQVRPCHACSVYLLELWKPENTAAGNFESKLVFPKVISLLKTRVVWRFLPVVDKELGTILQKYGNPQILFFLFNIHVLYAFNQQKVASFFQFLARKFQLDLFASIWGSRMLQNMRFFRLDKPCIKNEKVDPKINDSFKFLD